MFLLGQWKNFDDLEESVTLDELVQIFNSLTERENRRMEFQAQLAGAEIKSSGSKSNQQADTTQETLEDRLRRRKQQDRESSGKQGKRTEFSHGVGYQTIGG